MAIASGAVVDGFTYSTGITRPRHALLNSGTLALLEPGDPLAAVSGNPAVLPNIAAPVVNARASGAGAGWGFGEESHPGVWKRERTSKGALHAASSTTVPSGPVAVYRGPAALSSLLASSREHTVCSYLVGRVTKLFSPSQGGGSGIFGNFDSPAGGGPWQMHIRRQNASDTGMQVVLYSAPGATASGFGYGDDASWSGGIVRQLAPGASFSMIVATDDPTTVPPHPFMGWRAVGTAGYGLIFYLAGMEDLTVSGRSFETVRDEVEGWRQSELLAPGGRYYGDTWTPPTVLAP